MATLGTIFHFVRGGLGLAGWALSILSADVINNMPPPPELAKLILKVQNVQAHQRRCLQ